MQLGPKEQCRYQVVGVHWAPMIKNKTNIRVWAHLRDNTCLDDMLDQRILRCLRFGCGVYMEGKKHTGAPCPYMPLYIAETMWSEPNNINISIRMDVLSISISVLCMYGYMYVCNKCIYNYTYIHVYEDIDIQWCECYQQLFHLKEARHQRNFMPGCCLPEEHRDFARKNTSGTVAWPSPKGPKYQNIEYLGFPYKES